MPYNLTPAQAQVTALPNTGHDARVHAFRCGTLVDSFAVLTERFTVLVDTLVNPAAMVEVMRLLDDSAPDRAPSLLVINTHGDWDHVWGNGLFAGPTARFPAPIVGSRQAVAAVRSDESHRILRDYRAQDPARYDQVALVPPTIALDGGGQIDGGDLTLELIPTPGHTPDHLAVWIPEIRTILAGDAAEASMPYVNEAAWLPQLRAGLRRLQELQPRSVLACHRFGGHSPDLLAWNLSYFDQLEARCREEGDDADSLTAAWPLEAAVPERWYPPAEYLDFYRSSHARAARAMLDWVRAGVPDPGS